MSVSGAASPAVHDTGRGPALLLLHAFPLDASQWDHQVAALSGSFRCLRPDMWGCGASPAGPPGATLEDFAGAVLAALDARGVEDFAVVGLSLGGYVAFPLLRMAGGRVSALVLGCTRAGPDTDAARGERLALAERLEREQSVEPLVEANVERLLGPRARAEPHVTDPLRGRTRRWTPGGAAATLRAMAGRPDSTPMLGAITAPTLVVSGRHDAVVQAEESTAMAAAIPGAQHEVMDTGHLASLEDAPGFTRLLQSLLRPAAPVPSA